MTIKTSLHNISELCNNFDLVFLQETWLFPFDLDMLSKIHPDFEGIGTSAMGISKGIFYW